MFSFGSSAYYGNRSFEELVNSDWPSQVIVVSLERRLIMRIQAAQIAITRFLSDAAFVPGQVPRVASPAFTNNSIFALRIQQLLHEDTPNRMPASPQGEDEAWSRDVNNHAQLAYDLASLQEVPETAPASPEPGTSSSRPRPPTFLLRRLLYSQYVHVNIPCLTFPSSNIPRYRIHKLRVFNVENECHRILTIGYVRCICLVIPNPTVV